VEPILLDARWRNICTTSAYRLFRLVEGATGLTGRADLHAAAAQPAYFGLPVKGCAETSVLPPAAESDGPGHHLFLAHPHAQSAKDTVLMLLPESLLPHIVSGSNILDSL
jgi:hypothetical protein